MLRPSLDRQDTPIQRTNIRNVSTLPLTFSSSETQTCTSTGILPKYFKPFYYSTSTPLLNRKTWNQIEPELMESSPSQSSNHSTESGYGVVRRQAKVAKGVQTDDVRKRCWRHRRGLTIDKTLQNTQSANDGTPVSRQDSRNELSVQSVSSNKSMLRNALPMVNFPRWTRMNKKDDVVAGLVESYLGTLYTPFASVRKQLIEQVLSRCRDVGQEHLEAHYLSPTASLLRTVRECERELPSDRHRDRYKKHRNGRKTRKKKPSSGWPLCSRGCLIVHIADPDLCALRAGDFYFVATPVGVSLKWKSEPSGPIRERSLDAREFSAEMAALVASKSDQDEDDEEERRTSLLVAGAEGISRVVVGQLLEELFEGSWRRNRLRCTRDSWVQTEKDPSKEASAAEEPEREELQPLAPLASEEEFCSDTEQKQKLGLPKEKAVDEESVRPKSPLPEIRHPSAITDLAENALNFQVAIMPGSRDICSRSVVYISLGMMEEHSINAVDLAEILLYFQSIPKRETMCLGFLAVVDGRGVAVPGAWSNLHKALALVEETAPGTISLVLALHKQSHKLELLSSKYPIFHIRFEPIVNENQLLKYVAKDQLLPEYSGTYKCDHHTWVEFHKFLDPFIVSCHQMGCRLVKLIQDLRYGQLPSVLTNQLIEEQKKQIMEVLENEQLRYLEEEGSTFLKQLEEYRKHFENNLDFEEAVEKSKMLYKQLKKVVQRLARLADKRLNKLQECMMMKVFEEESSQVLTWLHRKGEETLKKHKTLAETLNAIREQENEFEKFYFLAMRQIERGNDLLEEIPKVRNSEKENGISSNLKRQLDDFTDRLEDAREKLEDTSRCYQLLDKAYEWSLETMRFVSHMKVDSTTSVNALVTIMKRLDTYLQAHPYIEDGIFEEMMKLALKLSNHTLLTQCQTARAKYEETVELIQTRQETLIKAKDRMTYEERPNINENLDNLKIKPCLWNPLSPNAPYRTSSQTYLNGYSPNQGSQNFNKRETVGSYTSFPSSYYPSSSFRDRLLGLSQRKNRTDYFAKRGSLTEELVFGRHNTSESESSTPSIPHGRKSYPFSSDSMTNLNVQSGDNDSGELKAAPSNSSLSSRLRLDDSRNWKICEAELKRYADEIRVQNQMLEQQRLSGPQESIHYRNKNHQENGSRPASISFATPSYTSSNPEEHQKPIPVNSHLMRCASCSDFEELLSSKTSGMETLKMANNRTLKLVMMEMIQTERDYVKSLGYVIENYVPLLQNSNVSQTLRSQRNVVFGNLEKIYEFHNSYFLQELEQCETIPYSVGQCFLKYESQFYLYALYNKNKPKSDSLMAEYGNNFFRKKQHELGDKMDLASYLLKPVQRMGKYALLLKQLLKECPETNSEHYNNLKAAEEMVRFQLRHGNDLLAMDALKECDVNIKEQGRLLRQDEFLVWQGKSKKALRRVFLFEDLIIFSKAKRDPECKGHDYYQYKSSIKTSDLGLTAQVGESPTKFEIWFRKCKSQDLYVLQAPSAEVKNSWVEEVSSLLWKQAERNRNLRLEEMSSMGIGNKPCLDITPSHDQICDRSISLQQLNKVPRFRNSIAVSSSDNFNNNEPRRRPLSIISLGSSSSSGDGRGSSTFYDTNPLEEVEEAETDKRRSMAQQSQCSAESGIFTDLSTSGDSYVENVRRLKTVERSDSVLSRTSYTSVEAVSTDPTDVETSTTTSSPSGLVV